MVVVYFLMIFTHLEVAGFQVFRLFLWFLSLNTLLVLNHQSDIL